MASASSKYTDYHNLIQFTPAGRDKPVQDKLLECQPTNDSLTGEQARSFYESVIDNKTGTTENIRPTKRACKKGVADREYACTDETTYRADELREHQTSELPKHVDNFTTQQTCRDKLRSAAQNHRLGNDLLKFSQNGELKELKKLLEKRSGVSIDYQDHYGWSALMCAVVSGHEHVIQYLLTLGASRSLRNIHGETALDLAGKVSNSALIKLLQEFSYSKTQKHKEIHRKFYCEICKSEFTDSDKKVHRTSTLHLFNMKLKPKPDPFMIPESNVGYQLMKKSGWDGEKGLGPKCQGQRYPVKTALKRDRSCLGSDYHKKAKAKITHFKPNDVSAIKPVYKPSERIMTARTASKKAQRRKESKDREWERNLRLQFYME